MSKNPKLLPLRKTWLLGCLFYISYWAASSLTKKLLNNWLLSFMPLFDDFRCILPKSNELLAKSANAWLFDMFENCLEDFFLFIWGTGTGGYLLICFWLFLFYLLTVFLYFLPFDLLDLLDVLERLDCLLSNLTWLFLDLLLFYRYSLDSKLDLLYLIFTGCTSESSSSSLP